MSKAVSLGYKDGETWVILFSNKIHIGFNFKCSGCGDSSNHRGLLYQCSNTYVTRSAIRKYCIICEANYLKQKNEDSIQYDRDGKCVV